MQLTSRLTPDQVAGLHADVISVLTRWRDRLMLKGDWPKTLEELSRRSRDQENVLEET